MPRGNPKCSDEEFIKLIRLHGPTETGKILGISVRGIFKRKQHLSQFEQIPTTSAVRRAFKFEKD